MQESNFERENMILKARVRQLLKALHQDDQDLRVIFSLPPTLADFFGLLLAKKFVSRNLVQYEMNVVADAQVAVWRLRQILGPQGVVVRTRRGLGWFLDEETKQRVNALLKTRQPIGDENGEEAKQGEEDYTEADNDSDSGDSSPDDITSDGYNAPDSSDYGSPDDAAEEAEEHDQAIGPSAESEGGDGTGEPSAVVGAGPGGRHGEGDLAEPAGRAGEPSASPPEGDDSQPPSDDGTVGAEAGTVEDDAGAGGGGQDAAEGDGDEHPAAD